MKQPVPKEIKQTKKKRKLKIAPPKVGCPFCWEWLPPPELVLNVFSGDGAKVGRCECGVYFVVDEIGKAGGQALLDVQAYAVDGDLDRALTLKEGVDFELKTRAFQKNSGGFDGRTRGQSHLQPKIWALRLLEG